MTRFRGHRRPAIKRMGELERYGVLALVLAGLLAVGYLTEELRRSHARGQMVAAIGPVSSGGFDRASRGDTGAGVAFEEFERPGGGSRRAASRSVHFDFFEPPVRRAGRSAEEVPDPRTGSEELRTVVVRDGDTLEKIAARELGSSREWRRFLAANPGIEPRRLQAGQRLTVPGAEVAVPAQDPWQGQYYLVSRNDTLESISLRHYGTRSRWIDILEANRDIIKSPEQLRAGTRIRLP